MITQRHLGTTAPFVTREKQDAFNPVLTSTSSDVPGLLTTRPTFEDFVYYATAQREIERTQDGIKPGRIADKLERLGQSSQFAVKHEAHGYDSQVDGLTSLEVDKVNAWRALRQASWASAFYLCTTDILGPFNSPYAYSRNGYVPGTLLYVFMGGCAFYCGGLLWLLYVKLDSDRFPVKSYSDITERVAGRPMRVFVTWLVFIHMIVNVGTTSLGNAQSLYQVVHGKICFVVAIVVWVIVGMILCQIRTLKRYSWLASMAIWLNLAVVFLSVGFISHSPPNYAAAKAAYGIEQGPVERKLFSTYPLTQRLLGCMQIVYAYGGATIFPQIIFEMRRPMDFLKAFSIAQALIFTIYIFYGLFVYSYQGQYTLPVAYQGVSKYSFQTAGNVISLVSGILAGGLYGNIGLKIAYVNIVEDLLKGPPLLSKNGRIAWAALVVAFWSTGFVLAAAIPQVQTLSGMVGAVTNMQFTYSFPSGFCFLYLVQLHAAEGDKAYVPGSGSSGRIDTWKSWSRWSRGLFGGSSTIVILFKWANFTLCLAALATAGLGIYGSGVSIANAFDSSAGTSFGCAAPV